LGSKVVSEIYIGVTENISAIIEIYRRNSKYISDF